MIHLDLNESPLGPSPKALEAMRLALARAGRYPRGESLATALGDRWQRSAQWFAVGTGGDDLIRRVVDTFAHPGPVVAFHPTFTQYSRRARIAARPYVPLPLTPDGRPCWDERAARAVPAGPALCVVVSPNNPTGGYAPVAATLALCDDRPDWTVLLDEAYVEFSPDPLGARAIGPQDWPENLLVLRTFSKVYGLAGLRVGYLVAKPETAAKVRQVGDEMPVASVSEAAAVAALADEAHVRAVTDLVRCERVRVARRIKELAVSVWPSEANFLLIEIGSDATTLQERLAKAGVAVRDGNRLGVPGTLRVSVGTRAENDAFLSALARSRAGLCLKEASPARH